MIFCASGSVMSGHRRVSAGPQAHAGVRARIAGFAYAALLPPAAFAVHQLRYLLAYGGNAGIELQRTGPLVSAFGRAMAGSPAGGGYRRVLAGVGPSVRRAHVAGAFHAVADRHVARVLGRAGRDIRLPGVPRGPVRHRAPGGMGRGSSATAAGGRSPQRCASAWCWRRCCTARAGSCGRSLAGKHDRICCYRTSAARRASPRCSARRTRRRWSAAGRVGGLRGSVDTRGSLGCEPRWRILPPLICRLFSRAPVALVSSWVPGEGPCYR